MKLDWGCTFIAASALLCAQTAHATPVFREEPPPPEETKYFHEPGGDDILGHYDSRFFKGVVSDEIRVDTLSHMIRAYLLFFNEKGLETWIAHGSLLGWWWNGKMLPWDWDVDTQVTAQTLMQLSDHYNQTIYKYVSEDKQMEREYLLDVNPFSRNRFRGEGLNIIDARWIDVQNGLYIDITGLSEMHPDTEPGILSCKNYHKYKPSDLFPMRMSTYEGVPAKIPYKYQDLLIKEYGQESLVVRDFENHDWDDRRKEWIPNEKKIAAAKKQQEDQKTKQQEEQAKKLLERKVKIER